MPKSSNTYIYKFIIRCRLIYKVFEINFITTYIFFLFTRKKSVKSFTLPSLDLRYTLILKFRRFPNRSYNYSLNSRRDPLMHQIALDEINRYTKIT